ncbi:uncharacterized protein BXIN_1531 [Babesia sp. Xinjiang]|uniref:uncharacterized protein n=1 Tax=Babesia sp. Xinjiang TaxID=462227 RepID=UPI000A22EEE1|nr:uncharacterized protein BXIN_1531 [Babesia sp. Xinjiang]ORM42186.1 hypothetical protein BXIN_1531 [Babesia sp. Xinjiang]
MTRTRWKWGMTICAMAFILVDTIRGVELDLSQAEVPKSVDVYEGKFGQGGIYRMYHSKDDPISLVKYGSLRLERPKGIQKVPIDVYVEAYKRDKVLMVAVNLFHSIRKPILRRSYFVVADKVNIVPRDAKTSFIGGRIYLPLNLINTHLHPYVLVDSPFLGSRGFVWHIVEHNDHGLGQNQIGRMRCRRESYFLNPIFNIDVKFLDTNGPKSSLSSLTTMIEVSPSGENIKLKIKLEDAEKLINLKIPPVENGIFKPQNIMDDTYNIIKYQPGCNTIRYIHLMVDISTLETQLPDIVILANLRRGCWLYRQYSIAPIRKQKSIHFRIISSLHKLLLCEVDGATGLTHVEVFDHIKHGWQYVVINTKVPCEKTTSEDAAYMDVKKIYKRMEDQGSVVYFDLSKFCVEPYLDMLYNINTLEKSCDKACGNDIVMDTSSSSSLCDDLFKGY